MKVKHLAMTAIFAALTAIGGLLKIPLGVSSIALDAAPALIATAFLPPVFVGITALIGHVASALYGGFPLGPFHILVALEMFVILFVFAKIYQTKKGLMPWLFFILANGLLAPLPFIFLISPAFFVGLLPGLLLATTINGVIAAAVLPVIEKRVLAEKRKMP